VIEIFLIFSNDHHPMLRDIVAGPGARRAQIRVTT